MKSALQRLRELRGRSADDGTNRDHVPGAVGTVAEATSPTDLPSDWRIEWEERAAIREYDGGQAREHAEAEALREIIERMRQAGGTSLSDGQPRQSERRNSSG